jgi:ketosteroid isomerase-like protein
MSTKNIIDNYFRALEAGTGWDVWLGPDLVFTSNVSPVKRVTGRESYLAATRGFYSMIVSFELRDLIIQGDRACALTHYELRAPSGHAFQSDVAEIFSVRNDRIESFAIYFDPSPFPR